MTNTKNQIKSIILTILAVVIIASMICAILGIFDNTQKQEVSAETVIRANGNVEAGYESEYKNVSGAIAIYDEATLAAFLTTAGTAEVPVYGYLTKSFSTSRTMNGAIVDYHYLDGCGFEIELTDKTGVPNDSFVGHYNLGGTNGAFASEQNNLNNYFFFGSKDTSAQSTTPFGYTTQKVSNVYPNQMGYFAGLLVRSEWQNLKVQYNGSFYNKDTNSDAGWAIGIIAGYAYKSTFDNFSLVVNGRLYNYLQQKYAAASDLSNPNGDIEGFGTVCFGGYAGVINQSNIKNSYIEITKNNYLSAITQGRKNGAYNRGYERSFVGGMVGCNTNASEIINVTAAGQGVVYAWELGPTKDSGDNRMGLSGIICGSNLNCSTPAYAPGHMGNSNTKVSACASGIVDGVICSWTGVAAYYMGKLDKIKDAYALAADDGSGNKAENHFIGGCIAGGSDGDTIKNVYYTFDLSTLEETANATRNAIFTAQGGAASAASDATRISPVGYSDTVPSPNYLKMGILDDNNVSRPTTGTFNSSTLSFDNAQVGVFTLSFDGMDKNADIKIDFDVTKSDVYVDDAGMFTWNIHLFDQNGIMNEINRNYYEMATSIDDAVTNYGKVSVMDVITRGTNGLNVTLDGSYGYAVTYKLKDKSTANYGGKTYDLGSKTYDSNSGLSTPNVCLYTRKGGVETQFNYNGSNSAISILGSDTFYNDKDIWTVYKKNSFTEYGFNIIKDAGTYEIAVYNKATSGYEENYDFINSAIRMVAYKADNPYYEADALKWMPYYTYTINQATINADWETITNEVDGTTYTSPVDFTYFGGDANFNYKYNSGLIGSDTGKSVMEYFKVKYVKVAANRLLNGTEYYVQNADKSYTLVGTRGENWTEEPTEEYYYKKNYAVSSNIKDAGEYQIKVSDFSNPNYKITLEQKEYNVVVSPRKIAVKFQNLNAVEYTAFENKATYVVVNHLNEVLNQTEGVSGLDASNANIVISNVYDATAINFEYTPGNDYVSMGRYSMTISLADGSVADNYLLPNASEMTSVEGEVLEGEGAIVDVAYDEYGNVHLITRYVDIGYANLKMCREHEGGKYKNSSGVSFDTYDVIYSVDPTKYPKKTISIDGIDKEVYSETEYYKGYNNVPCVMMGVCINTEKGIYETIYTSCTYYPATLVDGKYVVDKSQTYTTVTKAGIYVVCITFNTTAYVNYNAIEEYMLYEVKGVEVTISMDTSALVNEVEYSATDLTNNYSTFASVEGLKIADINQRHMGIIYKYYLLDETYVGEDKYVFNAANYRPVEKPQDAGKYLVIADNNINTNNYAINMDASCVNVVETVKPYYEFTITKITINATANATEKVYGEEFGRVISYTITSEKTLIEGDDVEVKFSSAGCAADADVGEYEIISACTGTSANNYIFVVDSSAKFTVTPRELTYNVGSLTKAYGDEFDTATIDVAPIGNQIFEKDGVKDDVYPIFASDGFSALANVDVYNVTATLGGVKSSNYTVVVSGTITLSKVKLTLNRVEAPADCVYDGTEKHVKVFFDNTKNGDEPEAVVRYNYNDEIKPINVGKYYVVVMNVNSQNYIYSTTKETSLEFDITKRELKVNVQNFTMGYGDTKLTPTGDGYAYTEDSLRIVDGDEILFSYKTETAETMSNNKGTYENVVIAEISGASVDNYSITVVTKGNLTIEEKSINTMALVDSSAEYTGSNLYSKIVLDTSAEGCTFIVKNSNGEVVDEIINVGTYTVVVSGDGVNYVGEDVELTFDIVKAHIASDYLTVSDLVVGYNSIKVAGKAAGEKIQVSENGTDFIDADMLKFDITDNSRPYKTIYIKLLESDTHLDSEVIRLSVKLTYNPNTLNQALAPLANKLTFKDIDAYKKAMADYELISEVDKGLVNGKSLKAAKDNYNKLISSATKAIVSAKNVAAKMTNRTYQVATAAAASMSIGGLLVVGLIALKKKKENQ